MSAAAVKVRDDGFCAGPGCRNVRPEAAVKAGDAFCSRACASAANAAASGAAPRVTRTVRGVPPDLFERGRAALESVRTAVPVAAHVRAPRGAPSQQATLDCLTDGPKRIAAIAKERGISDQMAYKQLTVLIKKGLARRVSHGLYALATDSGREPQAEDATGGEPEPSRTASTPPVAAGRAPSRPDGPAPSLTDLAREVEETRAAMSEAIDRHSQAVAVFVNHEVMRALRDGGSLA